MFRRRQGLPTKTPKGTYMGSLVITVKSEQSQAYLQQFYQLSSTRPKEQAAALAELFRGAAGGVKPLSVDVQTGNAAPVAASGTITLASCVTDTVTIGGVTFTGSASPSGEEEFETDGDDTADAAALAAKINAHSTLSKIVSATSALGVVTVTCLVKGVVGNFITLAETGTTITVSGPALQGGTGGVMEAAVNYNLGIS